jgi:hypothetical protein
VQEAIATADPLQEPTLDTVVEELGQVPGGNAALPKNEAQANMLNAGSASTEQKAEEQRAKDTRQ